MTPNILFECTINTRKSESDVDVEHIIIFEDGLVRFWKPLYGGEIKWIQLDRHELEEIDNFIFNENKITSISQKELDRQAQDARKIIASKENEEDKIKCSQSPYNLISEFRFMTDKNINKISYSDLSYHAHLCPEADVIQRLRAIEIRISELAGKFDNTKSSYSNPG